MDNEIILHFFMYFLFTLFGYYLKSVIIQIHDLRKGQDGKDDKR